MIINALTFSSIVVLSLLAFLYIKSLLLITMRREERFALLFITVFVLYLLTSFYVKRISEDFFLEKPASIGINADS